MSDEIARYKRALKAEREKSRELAAALEEAIAYVESAPDATALEAELAKLREAMTEGAYRVAWEDAATKAGIDPERFDDLWRLSPPEMDPDQEPDPKALADHVKTSVASRKSFVKNAPEGDDQADDEGDGKADDGDPFRHFATAGKADGDGAGKAKAKAVPALAASDGAARGGRDSGKAVNPFEQLNRDFAATGRADAFKL